MVRQYVGATNFVKNLLKGGTKGSGKAIKNIDANDPKNKLEQLTRDVKLLDQKAKATKALVDQTNFEIKNPEFSKGIFTFDPRRKNVTKESVKKRNKKSEEMFEASKGRKYTKGGRVGLKFGSRKSNVQKIKETFGPKKQLSAKQMKIAKLAGDPKKIDAQDLAKLDAQAAAAANAAAVAQAATAAEAAAAGRRRRRR